MKNIYLDHASTTYVDPLVFEKMKPYFSLEFGNPSSNLHSMGRNAKKAIDSARENVANIIGASPEEIIFTGSGTESDNLAILGVARAYKNLGNHIIVSKIEHKAVLESAKKLEKEGFKVTYLNVDKNGIILLEELKKAINKNTILVSIMYANNEIGVVEPIKEISEFIKNLRKENVFPLFHTDACQAAGALSLNIAELGVDLMTCSGSKIYGPKGIGFLYKKKEIKIEPQIFGGGQENGLRSGTENVALIVGLSEALKLTEKNRLAEYKRLSALRDYFIKKISKIIPFVKVNGDLKKRLPNNINISIPGIEGESIALMLDKHGICVSTGSACASKDLLPSYVLLALGLSPEYAHGSIRLTLGRKTTKKDLDYVLEVLPKIAKRLKEISSIKI